jgi:hypothetical protein
MENDNLKTQTANNDKGDVSSSLPKPCEHKFAFRGLHVEGKETYSTCVSMKTLYEIYFCEKCLETKRKFIDSGYYMKVPAGASTKGYGFR